MHRKKNIQSASNSLKFKEYKEAIEYIDLAINDPSTKEDPKAWMMRGDIYLTMDQDPAHADKGHYKEAVTSYIKVAELKATHETDRVNNGLMYGAYKAYNASVGAYNAKKYDEAYENAKLTINVHDLDGGKRFNNKSFDTVAAGALVIQAYSAFYGNEFDKALPVLEQLKNNPIEGNANTYLIIADVYKKKGDQAKELVTLEEARKRFPDNASVRNEEMNFYIRTKQQDKLVKKLEEAVNANPENAVYQYNLANAYTNMAFPQTKDESGKSPANYEELIKKAETGFTKALSLDPDNIGYHFDFGVLYINQASIVVSEMNKITGTTAADDKKYNDLMAVRDALFGKALPHLEKVYLTLDPKVKNLDNDNKDMYLGAVKGLREIYVRQDKLDKAKEMKTKLEQVK